jgi:uncharacterized protein
VVISCKKSFKRNEVILKEKSIIKSIQEQNALSLDLEKKIHQIFDIQELEDIYLPYKRKKQQKQTLLRFRATS